MLTKVQSRLPVPIESQKKNIIHKKEWSLIAGKTPMRVIKVIERCQHLVCLLAQRRVQVRVRHHHDGPAKHTHTHTLLQIQTRNNFHPTQLAILHKTTIRAIERERCAKTYIPAACAAATPDGASSKTNTFASFKSGSCTHSPIVTLLSIWDIFLKCRCVKKYLKSVGSN